jgi:hypothetical protein
LGIEVAARFAAKDRFLEAHRKAWTQDLTARLRGKSNDLLPFESLLRLLQNYQQIQHPEPQMVPLGCIVGSVGRYRDFTRTFLPRKTSLLERWSRIDRHMDSLEGLPPVELFKVGDVYFVADGNHRVSVARANGFDQIEAYVTEYPIDAGLEPGDTLDQALIKAGRVRFLAETRLDEQVPNPDIFFTKPGGYRRLLEHVEVYRRQMEATQPGRTITLEAAALHWYEHAYLPIIQAIRERNLLARFPGRTAADLYIWVWNTLRDLHRSFGAPLDAEEGAALLESHAPNLWQRAVQEFLNRVDGYSRARRGVEVQETPGWMEETLEWGGGFPRPVHEGEGDSFD